MNEELQGARPSERLAALGIELPEVAKPVAAYVPSLASSGQILTSGQLPTVNGALLATGKVGREVTPEQAERIDLARSVGNLSLVLRNQIDQIQARTDGIRKADLLGDAPFTPPSTAAAPWA